MLKEKDEKLLQELVVKAKDKIETDYEIEIKGKITIDKEKTLDENRAIIISLIKSERDLKLKEKGTDVKTEKAKVKVVNVNTAKQDKEKKAKLEAEGEAKKLKAMREQEQKTISEWKKQFNPEMIIKSPAYFEMEQYIEMVCDGFSNFSIIEGAGGLAKTFSANAILKKKQVDYAYFNSFTSPVSFFNFLYDNSGFNGQEQKLTPKVILIDDTEGIWENRAIISILKNATELNGQRTISWNSTTSKIGNRTNTTPFHSRIILLTNKLPNPEKNAHIEALKTRANHTELNFSYREKLDVIKEISKKEYQSLKAEQRKEIFEFIDRNTSEATSELSIRTLFKVYHFYLFDKNPTKDTPLWKELGTKLLRTDYNKETVIELINSGKPVKDQERIYYNKTGRSRADFYRVRKEIKPKLKVYI